MPIRHWWAVGNCELRQEEHKFRSPIRGLSYVPPNDVPWPWEAKKPDLAVLSVSFSQFGAPGVPDPPS
jgi:hypothetical protein